MKQTCILVLGMHRSGTSALTGVLSMLDVHLGSKLMAANFANEKGYFENDTLYRVNEKLLSKINSSWDDTFYTEDKLKNVTEIQELKNIIQQEFEFSNVFAIKDPRLIFLFPIYKQTLEELDIEIKIILPYRNPVEVANSLNTRDGISLEKGMLLWGYHFLLAEKHSRGYKRVFISFDELIEDTSKTIHIISKKLELDLESKYQKNKQKIDDFLEPSLKHHNISIDNLSSKTPVLVREVLALKDKFNDDIESEFDKLREEFFSYQKLFYNREIISFLDELQKTKENLTQKDKELAQTKENLTQKDKELAQTKENLTQKDKELAQTKDILKQKEKLIQKQQEEIEALKDELVFFYEDSQCMLSKAVKKIKGLVK